MSEKRGKANSLDIAHLAGVSQSTVSRALRGHPMVNARTRERILKIARELNYTVDKNASNLRLKHSGTLALLFFEDPTVDDSAINPFFLSMLGSVTRACSQQGYDLLISFQELERDWHADYEDSSKADGIILLGYGDYVVYRSKLEKLIDQGTHFVRWGAVLPDQPGLSIGCDNLQGGRLLTEHLLSLGHRQIAFLGDAAPGSPEFFERYHGYEAALREAGIEPDPTLRVDAISTEADGYRAMQTLLDRGVPFDAVFGASDLIAIGALHALADAGRRVPDDIAVVGFDDIPMSNFTHPALTTVSQDTKRAGELLVECLLNLINDRPAACVTLPPRLIVRGSCGSAGGARSD